MTSAADASGTLPAVSVIVPHELRTSGPALAAFVRYVEDAGLDGVFVGDHLVANVPIVDSTVLAATMAAASTRVRVGFGVYVLALRHPAWAAKQVAALQLLSGDRIVLGVGVGGEPHGTAGWDAVGVPWSERGRATDRSLAVLRDLVAGREAGLDGGPLTLAPGAIPPPVWIGGGGPASRRRAVRHGDGWFPSMVTPATLRAGAEHLGELAAAAGRERPAVAVGGAVRIGPGTTAGDPELAAHVAGLAGYGVPADVAADLPLTGSPAAVADRLAAYAAAGAGHAVLGLVGADWKRQVDGLAAAVRLR